MKKNLYFHPTGENKKGNLMKNLLIRLFGIKSLIDKYKSFG